MQKSSPTYRILSLVLAVLIFVSSVGISVDLHYCSGEFKSSSLTGKAPTCHEPSAPACPHHQKMMEEGDTSNNCCTNKTLHFQSDSDKEISKTVNLPQPLQLFVVALFNHFYQNVQTLPERPVFYAYKPPPLLQDIPVLLQSFLI